MKNSVKSRIGFLFGIIVMLISSVAYAQRPGGQGGRQQGPPPLPNKKQIVQMVHKLSDAVGLSEKQEGQVLKLYQQHFETAKKKMQSNARPSRNEMEALRSDFEKNVKAILTPAQQKKYDTFLKKNEQRPPRRPPR